MNIRGSNLYISGVNRLFFGFFFGCNAGYILTGCAHCFFVFCHQQQQQHLTHNNTTTTTTSMAPPYNPYEKKKTPLVSPPPSGTPTTTNSQRLHPPIQLVSSSCAPTINTYKQQPSRLISLPPSTPLRNPYKKHNHRSVLPPASTVFSPKATAKRPPLSPLQASVFNRQPLQESLTAQQNKRQRTSTKSTKATNRATSTTLDYGLTTGLIKENIRASVSDSEKVKSTSISIFKVFASGLFCLECEKPVGSSLESLRRHMKRSHPLLFGKISNFAQFHASVVQLPTADDRQQPTLHPIPKAVIRLKCSFCTRSYGLQYNFNKHCYQSSGGCEGSVPIKILYTKLASGRFVEAQESDSSSSPSCGSSMLRKTSIPLRPFKTTETAISKYIRDDEDSDTFISLFAPLMQTDLSLESTLCVYIERYSTPPGEHERSLTIVLSMAERWLFQRARHEVSLIPGNYRASLLQFDSQDMGEVSQNLTYNFRHREQTLLPKGDRHAPK
jgi:hypothetical protein